MIGPTQPFGGLRLLAWGSSIAKRVASLGLRAILGLGIKVQCNSS